MPNPYWTNLKLKFAQTIQYRFDILIYILEGLASTLVALAVWLAVSLTGTGLSLTRNDLITYYFLLTLVSMWTNTWASSFVSGDIREGKLSVYLVRPLSYLSEYIGNNIAEKVQNSFLYLPIFVVLLALFHRSISVNATPQSVVLFLISFICAAILYFVIDMCIGLLAFWTDEVKAVISFYTFASSFFSGELVPLALLPDRLFSVATYLPFRYTLSFPLEVLTNRVSVQELIFGFVMLGIWLFSAVVLYKVLWSLGVRKYSAAGA